MKNGSRRYSKLRKCNGAMNAMNHIIICFIDSKLMPMLNQFVVNFSVVNSKVKRKKTRKKNTQTPT